MANDFMRGIKLCVNLADGEEIRLTPVSKNECGNITKWDYTYDGITAQVTAEYDDKSAVFGIKLNSAVPLAARAVTFIADPSFADKSLDYHLCSPWWMLYDFPKDSEDMRDQTQGILFEKDGSYIGVTNLVGDVFCAQADMGGLHLDVRCDGYTELEGYFLAASENEEPIEAVHKAFVYAREVGAINVPLRDEREYPELFEKFGWCSWNAFYQDVTADKLYSKLDEFKEKNIPVKWIIIDDGWSLVRESMLASFDADPVKFPEGLGACIRRIKEEYGIEGVGVWHTLNGYWKGVDPESEIGKKYADNLMTAKDGMIIPHVDPDKGFVFWDAFHSHLAECGVDFVKVDNQSTSYYHLENVTSAVAGTVGTHEAIEESIAKNFGGKVINCMGMNMVNVFSRPFTAISRNSDDFFPDRENGFSIHLRQNLYSAIWHTNMFYGDYDMWWSGKSAPVQSGVLRAMSGGPVYVSDAVGDSDLGNILPVCGKDGTICRMDGQAMPTKDCLFVNCERQAPLQKAFNRCGDAFALAIYNLRREDGCVTESFKYNVIPGMGADRDYVAYEYFSKKFSLVNSDTVETVTIELDGVMAYSLYPVMGEGDDAYIELGECNRYFGIASREKTKVLVKDIVK